MEEILASIRRIIADDDIPKVAAGALRRNRCRRASDDGCRGTEPEPIFEDAAAADGSCATIEPMRRRAAAGAGGDPPIFWN